MLYKVEVVQNDQDYLKQFLFVLNTFFAFEANFMLMYPSFFFIQIYIVHVVESTLLYSVPLH